MSTLRCSGKFLSTLMTLMRGYTDEFHEESNSFGSDRSEL